MADRAADAAQHGTQQSAQQLAPELLEVLSGKANAQGRYEFLDMPLVEFVAVGLADLVDEPHLQREDRHRGERFG